MRKYVIRCGSRSGSTYLGDLLISTNRCGLPKEYFNPVLERKFRELLDVDFNSSLYEYRKAIVTKTKTENDIVGIKVLGTGQQWNVLSRSAFNPTHWIWLERKDKVMQAISRYKAIKTKNWVHRKNKKFTAKQIKYCFADIKRCLNEIIRENNTFANFFKNQEHLKIYYESDLLGKPYETIRNILIYLEVNIDDLPYIKSSNRILRNGKDYEWKKRFLHDQQSSM